MSPPEREKRPLAEAPSHDFTDAHHSTNVARQGADDALQVVRLRPYKPSTGLRANGYRDGWRRCLAWTQVELDEHLDEVGRARLAAFVARSEAFEERPSANDVERGRKLCR